MNFYETQGKNHNKLMILLHIELLESP